MDPRLVERYLSAEGAAGYRHKYERTILRRLSNRREAALLERALVQARARGRVLDCPCGAGRMVPLLLEHAEHVTGVDLSEAMLGEARDALGRLVTEGRVVLVRASADALPFEDASFDTVVCHRLLHHVPDGAERGRILDELARVAARRVLLSFQDATTLKARWQRLRGRARRRFAQTPRALAREASARGLVLEPPVRRLSAPFSLVATAVFRVGGA